jgi:hypothetical protein
LHAGNFLKEGSLGGDEDGVVTAGEEAVGVEVAAGVDGGGDEKEKEED